MMLIVILNFLSRIRLVENDDADDDYEDDINDERNDNDKIIAVNLLNNRKGKGKKLKVGRNGQ